jgi:hypothetical protein
MTHNQTHHRKAKPDLATDVVPNLTDATLDELAASITPTRILAESRALLREPRFRPDRMVPFHVLVERLAGPMGAEGHPDRWHALTRVHDAILALLPHTPGVAYTPPT